MTMNRIDLGDKVKDTITGYTGIAVAKTDWLHGCTRITVKSQTLKDGAPIKSQTFDEPQLKLLKSKSVKRGRKDTGGPRPSPVTKSGPTRS